MKSANLNVVKDQLSRYIDAALEGEEVVICRRNVPVARLVAIEPRGPNQTRLGWAVEGGAVHDDLQGPMIPEADWTMLGA